jgi:large subunit ribosomal protein L15
MKLHDLKPAPGSNTARTRVGRGIAAGKGKTAGRGTKGQKARTGGSIPPWFEGGQTPIHIRIPKLRGFKNRGRIDYEVVNLGRISHLVELGELELAEQASGAGTKPARTAPITINQDILRAVGLVRTLNKPLKVLGNGDVSVALFVVADAFSKSAIEKIEAAGGSVQVLEIPTSPMVALTGEPATGAERTTAGKPGRGPVTGARAAAAAATARDKGPKPAPKPTATAKAAHQPAAARLDADAPPTRTRKAAAADATDAAHAHAAPAAEPSTSPTSDKAD